MYYFYIDEEDTVIQVNCIYKGSKKKKPRSTENLDYSIELLQNVVSDKGLDNANGDMLCQDTIKKEL